MATDSSSQSWDAHRTTWQTLTNARPIPPRHLQDTSVVERPALIRCVWDRDGETWVHGAAQDRAGELVHVRIDDDRIGTVRWAWVDTGDVRPI